MYRRTFRGADIPDFRAVFTASRSQRNASTSQRSAGHSIRTPKAKLEKWKLGVDLSKARGVGGRQQRGVPAYSQPWTTRRRLNSAGPQFEFHHHKSKVGTSQ